MNNWTESSNKSFSFDWITSISVAMRCLFGCCCCCLSVSVYVTSIFGFQVAGCHVLCIRAVCTLEIGIAYTYSTVLFVFLSLFLFFNFLHMEGAIAIAFTFIVWNSSKLLSIIKTHNQSMKWIIIIYEDTKWISSNNQCQCIIKLFALAMSNGKTNKMLLSFKIKWHFNLFSFCSFFS